MNKMKMLLVFINLLFYCFIQFTWFS